MMIIAYIIVGIALILSAALAINIILFPNVRKQLKELDEEENNKFKDED